jgi:hypothetical protein
VSSRRSASVVIALAVASLAVTSMGAMVASSELLVDAVDRPAGRRLDPLVLDLGSVGTIQAELPPDPPADPPPARRRQPAGDPPPRRREVAAPAVDREEDDDGGVVAVAQVRVVKVVKRVVVRKPVVQPRPLPLPPPRPRDPQPRPQWPRRRWAQPPQQRQRPPCGDRPWRWRHGEDRRPWDKDRRPWDWDRTAAPGARTARPAASGPADLVASTSPAR